MEAKDVKGGKDTPPPPPPPPRRAPPPLPPRRNTSEKLLEPENKTELETLKLEKPEILETEMKVATKPEIKADMVTKAETNNLENQTEPEKLEGQPKTELDTKPETNTEPETKPETLKLGKQDKTEKVETEIELISKPEVMLELETKKLEQTKAEKPDTDIELAPKPELETKLGLEPKLESKPEQSNLDPAPQNSDSPTEEHANNNNKDKDVEVDCSNKAKDVIPLESLSLDEEIDSIQLSSNDKQIKENNEQNSPLILISTGTMDKREENEQLHVTAVLPSAVVDPQAVASPTDKAVDSSSDDEEEDKNSCKSSSPSSSSYSEPVITGSMPTKAVPVGIADIQLLNVEAGSGPVHLPKPVNADSPNDIQKSETAENETKQTLGSSKPSSDKIYDKPEPLGPIPKPLETSTNSAKTDTVSVTNSAGLLKPVSDSASLKQPNNPTAERPVVRFELGGNDVPKLVTESSVLPKIVPNSSDLQSLAGKGADFFKSVFSGTDLPKLSKPLLNGSNGSAKSPDEDSEPYDDLTEIGSQNDLEGYEGPTLLAPGGPRRVRRRNLVIEGSCNYFFWMEKIAMVSL